LGGMNFIPSIKNKMKNLPFKLSVKLIEATGITDRQRSPRSDIERRPLHIRLIRSIPAYKRAAYLLDCDVEININSYAY